MRTIGTGREIKRPAHFIPLSQSLTFLFRRKRLVGISLLLFLVTIGLTWLGYSFSVRFIDGLTGAFFMTPPDSGTIVGWLQHKGWLLLKWLYLLFSRIVAFYLAFLLAYIISSPGYVFLATVAERLHLGESYEADEGFTLVGILTDLWEGLKIAAFGILVTVVAIFVNFVPVLGQILVFLLYTYYCALMFLDYPASRRRWSLGRKLDWLKKYSGHSFRLGVFPALVSMVPVFNVFFIALLFPLLTVHATLNFSSLELSAQRQDKNRNGSSPSTNSSALKK